MLICVVADPQVCSYRCIVSHESQLLEDFSLCVLQKHNCMGKSAEIPALPDPPPMAAFRGEDLTHELAESLFIGWLGGLLASIHPPGCSEAYQTVLNMNLGHHIAMPELVECSSQLPPRARWCPSRLLGSEL